MSLTLFYHPLSSYCHKALIALYEAGTSFTPRFLALDRAEDRELLLAHWPIGKFPVIEDTARRRSMPETTIIIEYLDRYYPGPHRMIPDDPDIALDVRLWDRIMDQYVHTPMQEIVANSFRPTKVDMSAQRALIEKAYGIIDRQLAGRTWLACEQFSLADCAAAPALFFASTLEPLPPALGALTAYFERLVARPSVQRTIEQAKPYFHMYPFAQAIPARFR